MVANTEHVQLLPPGHVNLPNVDNISRLLTKNGFILSDHFTLNPSLDIHYVLKLTSKNNKASDRLGNILGMLLSKTHFRSDFENLLRKQKMAGNIVVVAQKLE